MSMFARK